MGAIGRGIVRLLGMADKPLDDDTEVPGSIQVSERTMGSASALFRFEDRALDVKGLGPSTTYLVL